MTLLDFLTQTAVIASVIEAGQTLSPEEEVTILSLFNFLLDSWNTDRLNLYSVASGQYTLTSTQGTYPIGPTAASPFNVPRPTLIQSANIVVSGLTLPLDMQNSVQWAAITEKDNLAILPNKLYYDNAYPLGTLNLNPKPLCSSVTKLELFTWTILEEMSDLTVDIAFPPGYKRPLQYGLALELPSAFGLQVPEPVMRIAADAKAQIRMLNAQLLAGPVGEATVGNIPAIGLPGGGPQQPQQ